MNLLLMREGIYHAVARPHCHDDAAEKQHSVEPLGALRVSRHAQDPSPVVRGPVAAVHDGTPACLLLSQVSRHRSSRRGCAAWRETSSSTGTISLLLLPRSPDSTRGIIGTCGKSWLSYSPALPISTPSTIAAHQRRLSAKLDY